LDTTQPPSIRISTCDLNGQMRGKRYAHTYSEKVVADGVRMPLSALNVDLWGDDIDSSPLLFKTGDADGILFATERGPVPMPWLTRSSTLIPMWMHQENGQMYAGDPRRALAVIQDRYAKHHWHVQAATELEFTLVNDQGTKLQHAHNPYNRQTLTEEATLSLKQIDDFDAFFSTLYDSAEAMNIPIQAATSEGGIGQFEINLNHQPLLRTADDTWLFKALVRGIARKFGYAATFMAKPFESCAGNGMHVHFSILNAEGRNIFDNGGPNGTPELQNAVAGCLAAMPGSSLIFAPYQNSYERLIPESHAPTSASWAYENRTTALRIPGGDCSARRIEHRTPGGTVNPYVILAAILGAAFMGIEEEMIPPDSVTGNAYTSPKAQCLTPNLSAAIEQFRRDRYMNAIFDPVLIDNLCRAKKQELNKFSNLPEDEHWKIYLETV